MVFKSKFFLDLGSEGEQQKPVTIAPPAVRPATAATTAASTAATAAPTSSAPSSAAPGGAAPVSSRTTAEAIAAELAAAQANRPAPSLATFAPDCISAGGSLPRQRRRGGADLGGFREMARSMVRS